MKQLRTGRTLKTQRFGIHIEDHKIERITNTILRRYQYLTEEHTNEDQSIHVQSVVIYPSQNARLLLPSSWIPIRILR